MLPGLATIPKCAGQFLRQEQRLHHRPELIQDQLSRHPQPPLDAYDTPDSIDENKAVMLEALSVAVRCGRL